MPGKNGGQQAHLCLLSQIYFSLQRKAHPYLYLGNYEGLLVSTVYEKKTRKKNLKVSRVQEQVRTEKKDSPRRISEVKIVMFVYM